jgi:hypothetical protein
MWRFVGRLAIVSCGVGTLAGSAYGQAESENDPGDTTTAALGSDCPPLRTFSQAAFHQGQAPSPGGTGGRRRPGWRPPCHPSEWSAGRRWRRCPPSRRRGRPESPRLVRLVVIDEQTGEQGEVLVDENGVVQSQDEEVIS